MAVSPHYYCENCGNVGTAANIVAVSCSRCGHWALLTFPSRRAARKYQQGIRYGR